MKYSRSVNRVVADYLDWASRKGLKVIRVYSPPSYGAASRTKTAIMKQVKAAGFEVKEYD